MVMYNIIYLYINWNHYNIYHKSPFVIKFFRLARELWLGNILLSQ